MDRLVSQALRLLNTAERRLYASPKTQEELVNAFHWLYYYSQDQTWHNTYWLGVPVRKCPLDLWVYQEILFKVRPDVILETGTFLGGSALFLASMCDLLGKGHVISIDIEDRPDRPKHSRITYLRGSSISEDVIRQVRDWVRPSDQVLAIFDADHSKDHVLSELRSYAPFITEGGYFIVEDSNNNGHPVVPEHGPGPMEAIDDFLAEDDNFVSDRTWEKFYLSFNPRGYLKRIRRPAASG
jgi:cephalosporin hydroxylase